MYHVVIMYAVERQMTMLFVDSIFCHWRAKALLNGRTSGCWRTGLRWTQEFPGQQESAVGSLLLKRVPGRLEYAESCTALNLC